MYELKLSISVLLFVLLTNSTSAQDSTQVGKFHELGVGSNGSSTFNLRYQYGNDNFFYRVSLLNLSVSNNNSGTSYQQTSTNANAAISQTNPSTLTPINLGFGLNFIVGKVKALNDKIGISMGLLGGVNIAYNSSTNNYSYLINSLGNPNNSANYSNYSTTVSNASYNPQLGMVVGLRYKLNNHFFVFAEITPTLNYTLAWNKSVSTPGVNTPANTLKYTDTYALNGLALSNAMVTLQYRIYKN